MKDQLKRLNVSGKELASIKEEIDIFVKLEKGQDKEIFILEAQYN